MKGGGGGSSSTASCGSASSSTPGGPPLRLPLPSGCFLDHLPPGQKRARFNLLLLEHGEVYLGDYAVVRYRGKGRTKVRVPGRLKVSSRSLVFDPVGDASQPLLRFPYKHIARLSKYTPSAAEAAEYAGDDGGGGGDGGSGGGMGGVAGAGKGAEGLVILSCSALLEMKADDLVAPYLPKRCGPEHDYEGPDFVFRLQHTPLPDFLGLVDHLLHISAQLASTGATAHTEETLLRPLLEERERASAAFDPTHLVDFRERLLLPHALPVDRISPLVKNPGVAMLTDKRLYFQPAADLNNVGSAHPVAFPLHAIVQVFKRRYMLRQTGLEVFFSLSPSDDPSSDPSTSTGPHAPSPPASLLLSSPTHANGATAEGGTGAGGGGDKLRSILLAFRSSQDRDRVYDLMMAQPELRGLQHRQPTVAQVTRAWQARRLSNLEYLSYLNTLADRSYNDLTQYPVFPWVVADYTSKKLNWEDPATYRDLSKPIGALNEERLAYLKERMRSMPEPNPALGVPPKFLYGTHYSTPGYVLFYLVRAAPEYMLCLQDGKFDAADRMFVSVADTWRSCLSNPADLKELIPEFYCSQGEFLANVDGLPLGTTQGGVRVDDVVLPPWAKSSRDFVRKLRKALNESAYVSAHLHEWIDLVFGHLQRGPQAEAADNLFYYLTYEGAVDLEKVEDPVERAAFEAQIREFGQTPKQVFVGPHPRRDDPPTAAAAPILLAPAFQDPTAPPDDGGPPAPYTTSSPSAPVPIPPSLLPTTSDGGGSGSGSASAQSSADGSQHGGMGMGGSLMMSQMRPRGGSGTEAEWEMVRGDSLSMSLSNSLSQSASGGWEILSRRASESNGGTGGNGTAVVVGAGGGTAAAAAGHGDQSERERKGEAALSPASRVTEGLLASSLRREGQPPLHPPPPPPRHELQGGTIEEDMTPRPAGSVKIDTASQAKLEAMIRRAQEEGNVALADSLRLSRDCGSGEGGGGGEGGVAAASSSPPAHFPLSPVAWTAGGVGAAAEEEEGEGLPAVVRLEDLVRGNSGSFSSLHGGNGNGNGNGTNGGIIGESYDMRGPTNGAAAFPPTTTTTTAAFPPLSLLLTPLALEASAPFHHDKISSLQWTENGDSVPLLGSTSEDGSFRVGELVLGKGETASLWSKRHFAPSDVALSGCVLIGGGGGGGGEGQGEGEKGGSSPLAVLSSWDNHVYVYSLHSARQLLQLAAHEDSVSALAVSPDSRLLVTGSWDATVKAWALKPTSGAVDPNPIAEFYDLEGVQAVCVSDAGLAGAGAEDGRVAVWDVVARSLVACFDATAKEAPVVGVKWGGSAGGGGGEKVLYVAGGDGSLGCYALGGEGEARRVGCVARLGCEPRSLALASLSDGGAADDLLVVGGGDGSVSLWSGSALSTSTAACAPLVVVADAHAEAVTAVAVDWRKGLVASGAQDGTIRVWRVRQAE